MDLILEKCLDEYDELLPLYRQAEISVTSRLNEIIQNCRIKPLQLEHRIKDRDSVKTKIIRKSDKYAGIKEMTDVLGFRLVCFFSEDVDEYARLLEQAFLIDRDNSIDKRQMIAPNAFGYISLHYICSLHPEDAPAELSSLRFEIQIRTGLQHIWAEIEHDLGYKSEFDVPREIRREFSRLADLLEIADEQFSSVKKKATEYRRQVEDNIANDTAGDLNLDTVSLTEYMKQSRSLNSLLNEIADICGASIRECSPRSYLADFRRHNIETLGDLTDALSREKENILSCARKTLLDSELDELASTVAFYYLIKVLDQKEV